METTVKLSAEKLEKAAFILKTIAHPMRLGIIELLQQHERLSVNEISEALNCEQSLTSHHLANMKLKGILSCQREGKCIFYSLQLKAIVHILTCVEKCSC